MSFDLESQSWQGSKLGYPDLWPNSSMWEWSARATTVVEVSAFKQVALLGKILDLL